MPGKLTTHVLDTAAGKPAAGMRVDLFKSNGEKRKLIKTVRTNSDGRVDGPLLVDKEMKRGEYTLVFHVGDYFAKRKSADAKKFLNRVPVIFVISDSAAHYHVPLLVSPWAYSTYRGS